MIILTQSAPLIPLLYDSTTDGNGMCLFSDSSQYLLFACVQSQCSWMSLKLFYYHSTLQQQFQN